MKAGEYIEEVAGSYPQLLSCACTDGLYLTEASFTMWVQYKCNKRNFFKPSATEFGLLWWLGDIGS